MADVYNWQLGRDMPYPYPARTKGRQIGFVFNINRCIGCQTCTMACKSTWTHGPGQERMWWNNVETKPFGSFPHGWDVDLLRSLGPQRWEGGIYRGKTIFEAAPSGQPALGYLPPDKSYRAPNIYEDTTSGPVDQMILDGAPGPVHQVWFFYLQRICNHCSYPACLAACPRKAVYKREEDGIVLVDQKRCRGYRQCVTACPYKKVFFRPDTKISEKCIACYPRVEQGLVPRCVAACPGKIRLMGYLDDEAGPLHYLVHKARVALPLYPQFGTQPNVYYIPPRWAARPYLRQMFGPGVDHAVEQYARMEPELLGTLQLFGVTQSIIASYRITDTHAFGFDASGQEVASVPLEEPFVIRPAAHFNIT